MHGILDWYWLGVIIGLGVAAGTAATRMRVRHPASLALVIAVAAGAFLAASALDSWWAVLPFAGGAGVGTVTLRRLTLAAVPVAVLAVAVLAFVPLLGYLEALGAPFAWLRLRRRAQSRYAGLRILAKD